MIEIFPEDVTFESSLEFMQDFKKQMREGKKKPILGGKKQK